VCVHACVCALVYVCVCVCVCVSLCATGGRGCLGSASGRAVSTSLIVRKEAGREAGDLLTKAQSCPWSRRDGSCGSGPGRSGSLQTVASILNSPVSQGVLKLRAGKFAEQQQQSGRGDQQRNRSVDVNFSSLFFDVWANGFFSTKKTQTQLTRKTGISALFLHWDIFPPPSPQSPLNQITGSLTLT
jgi:hypothetical protein